jgi:hypothetical protein
VTFAPDAPGAAAAAMQRLNGATLPGAFGGRTVRVSPSNKWRGAGGGGGGGGGGGAPMAGADAGGVPR